MFVFHLIFGTEEIFFKTFRLRQSNESEPPFYYFKSNYHPLDHDYSFKCVNNTINVWLFKKKKKEKDRIRRIHHRPLLFNELGEDPKMSLTFPRLPAGEIFRLTMNLAKIEKKLTPLLFFVSALLISKQNKRSLNRYSSENVGKLWTRIQFEFRLITIRWAQNFRIRCPDYYQPSLEEESRTDAFHRF